MGAVPRMTGYILHMSSASRTPALPKLLLVDDLPANLLALEAILENQGYELIQVTSGPAAIAAVEQYDFAAILLDVNMPDMDGFETARRIKATARGGEVPIVFVTAVAHDAQRIRDAYNTGAVDFIPKPLDRDILRAKVRVFVDMYLAKDKRRAEADRLAEDLQNAGKLNEEFLASLGRELRAPLHTIIGWIRALRSGTVQEPQRGHALDAVERNAGAQLELIEEMLDMNNLAAGTLTLSTAKVDLAKLVQGVVTTLGPEASAASVRLEVAADPELRPLTGDPDRLSQITRQLTRIALKASPAGGSVRIKLARKEPHVQLLIEDHGDGIPAEILPAVFDGFDDTAAPASLRGMGLKLAILRRLVELHGGTIRADSEGVGRGSRFTVELPAS